MLPVIPVIVTAMLLPEGEVLVRCGRCRSYGSVFLGRNPPPPLSPPAVHSAEGRYAQKLLNDLMENYSSALRPVEDTDSALNVTLQITLSQIKDMVSVASRLPLVARATATDNVNFRDLLLTVSPGPGDGREVCLECDWQTSCCSLLGLLLLRWLSFPARAQSSVSGAFACAYLNPAGYKVSLAFQGCQSRPGDE